MTACSGDSSYQQHKPHYGGFSEADLVEQPAIELFAKLGWMTGNLFSEFSGAASAEGRSSKRESICRTACGSRSSGSTRPCRRKRSTTPIPS